MKPGTQLHRRKKKNKPTARHAAPRDLKKTAIRAAKVVPAIGAAGALAAAVAAQGSTGPAPAAAAGRLASASRTPARTTASNQVAAKTNARQDAANHGQAAAWHGSWLALHFPSAAPRAKRPVAHHRARPRVTTLRCTGTAGMLPQNYATIVSFLVRHGYTRMAAAGMAGNMYRESQGNPESVGTGGGGLIGFTPLPAGYVTGNPTADLQTQLQAVLTYNQQWAQYIPALNSATTPTQAADTYMTYFERPGIPAAYNREAAANAVAAACGF